MLQNDSLGTLKAYLIKYNLKGSIGYHEGHDAYVYDADHELLELNAIENINYNTRNPVECHTVFTFEWWCHHDYDHPAGPGCDDDGRLFTKSYLIEVCTDNSDGYNDPHPGGSGSGGGSGNGNNDGVVTAPNIIPYRMNLRMFTRDKLSNNERNYYLSNSNIKNNIDTYLINNSFSPNALSTAQIALGLGYDLSLDFVDFNLGFNNSNGVFADILNFLAQNQNSLEAKDFAREAIEAMIDGINVDFTDHLKGYNFHAESVEILAFEQDYKNRMSNAEKSIFDNLSRFQQLDYLHSAFLAETYAKQYFEDTPMVQYNGKGDAYRHTLWNALGAAKLGQDLMEDLTDAHEDRPSQYPFTYKENIMDFFNNYEGRILGTQSQFMLMSKVKLASDKGNLRYLSNTTPYATENSELTPTNQ